MSDTKHSNLPAPLPPIAPRDIERFEKYRNIEAGHGPNGDCHIWTGAKTIDGYGVFGIFLSGKLRTIKAHRLAWFIETGQDPYPMAVLHHCDYPPCVRVYHLFLGTGQDNATDRQNKGRGFSWFKAHPEIRKRGAEHHMSDLTDAEVLEMCQWRKDGMILREIAARKSMSISGVYSAINKYWNHLDKPEQRDMKHGENNPMAKLSNAQCREVVALSEQGMPQKRIASLFGVSPSLVSHIVTGRHRKMVE